MQATRQYFEDAPAEVSVQEFMHHQRLVVTMQIQESPSNQPPTGMKALLSSMPNVGEDADFSRQQDCGHGDGTWVA